MKEQIELIKQITEEGERYTAHNGKKCFRTFGGLDYYFLLCSKLNLNPEPVESGLSYEAKNDILELDYCEHDIILHIKKIFVKAVFSGWHEVSKEQAKKWASHMLKGANCKKETIMQILKNKILGATLEELGAI